MKLNKLQKAQLGFTQAERFLETENLLRTHIQYLCSNWATPTLILSWDMREQLEYDCYTDESIRFNSGSKWDDESLKILGISL